jgi:hypothetical protein
MEGEKSSETTTHEYESRRPVLNHELFDEIYRRSRREFLEARNGDRRQ